MKDNSLAPCYVCRADKMVLTDCQQRDSSKVFYAHCASCGLETGKYSTAEQVVFHWNERMPPEKVLLRFGLLVGV